MASESNGSLILLREHLCIARMAHKTHIPVATVQSIFLVEYDRLAAAANVKSYLPLLTANNVRRILELANASSAGATTSLYWATTVPPSRSGDGTAAYLSEKDAKGTASAVSHGTGDILAAAV